MNFDPNKFDKSSTLFHRAANSRRKSNTSHPNSKLQDFQKVLDKSTFANQPYVKKIEKPWGYELHWVTEDKPYMGKLLHVNKNARLSLQVHDQKQESWFLIEGQAKVIWDDENNNLVETELQKGQGYSCAIGQRHRLAGITDCNIIEVSTPEMGTTWRLEDDYKRPDETPEQRKKERGEI